MRAAFSPGHITLIFSIKDESNNILEKGSLGTGFSIAEGVITEVETFPSKKNKVTIYINGKKEAAPVSRSVVRQFFEFLDEKFSIILKHKINLPIGGGFGCSAAGALSSALALNEELQLNFKKQKCGQIAHIAEVENKTGLGDVIGSCIVDSTLSIGIGQIFFPQDVSAELAMPAILYTIFASFIVITLVCWRQKVDKKAGAIFLALYAISFIVLFSVWTTIH